MARDAVGTIRRREKDTKRMRKRKRRIGVGKVVSFFVRDLSHERTGTPLAKHFTCAITFRARTRIGSLPICPRNLKILRR